MFLSEVGGFTKTSDHDVIYYTIGNFFIYLLTIGEQMYQAVLARVARDRSGCNLFKMVKVKFRSR